MPLSSLLLIILIYFMVNLSCKSLHVIQFAFLCPDPKHFDNFIIIQAQLSEI